MKTTSQKISNRLPQESEQSAQPSRKHDAEIITARQHAAWIDFESSIHQNEPLRARVARSLDRYAIGSSSVMVDEAIDFLIHKDLGASAQYFNQTGKAQFNQRQVSNAVFTFMSRKEQQRHLSDLPIREDESDHDYDIAGSIPASHIHDAGTLAPDEAAARSEALAAIAAMIPEGQAELYDILLAIPLRQSETTRQIEAYARRHGFAASSIYGMARKLARTIQAHPMFAEIAAAFHPL